MEILSFRGYSAWITIDDESLPFYQKESAGTTCGAWIPSTAGQSFSVWWKDDSKSRIATSGHIFVDGRDVASAIMRPGRSKPVERSGAKTSSRTLKPFKFSSLRLTGMAVHDETIADKDDPTLRDMGIIKLEISRVKLGEEVAFKGYQAENHGMVHEKAKKLGAHCTSYGPSKRSSASRTVAVTTAPYDPDEPGPYVTFLFKYRSEDLLRANGIIGNQRKRSSPHDDDEVIVISDSDSDKEKSDGEEVPRAKKRARLEANGREVGSEPPQSEDAGPGDDVEPDVDGATHNEDVDMNDSQLDFGAPVLLQQPKEDESQTQLDDDVQLKFGAPSLLRQGTVEERNQAQQEGEDQEPVPAPQFSEDVGKEGSSSSKAVDVLAGSSQADAVTVAGERGADSQLGVEGATQMTEESQAY